MLNTEDWRCFINTRWKFLRSFSSTAAWAVLDTHSHSPVCSKLSHHMSELSFPFQLKSHFYWSSLLCLSKLDLYVAFSLHMHLWLLSFCEMLTLNLSRYKHTAMWYLVFLSYLRHLRCWLPLSSWLMGSDSISAINCLLLWSCRTERTIFGETDEKSEGVKSEGTHQGKRKRGESVYVLLVVGKAD